MSDPVKGKPLIGVSCSFHDFGDYLGIGFHRPIALAGGLSVILPRLEESLDELLGLCDGILLAGGHDLDPSLYGQAPTPHLGPTDPHRDAFEIKLVLRALDRGLPVLGMCRGLQVINVALGGTLVQDLSLVPDWREHPSDRGWTQWKQVEAASLRGDPLPAHPRHPIRIKPGSRLHQLLGVEEVEVDSFHHQAIDQIADGLRPVAWAPDGVIEAIEVEGGYGLAVQWELQEEWRVDRRFLALFEDFVAVCGGRQNQMTAA